jgi:hypothetical protein
VPFLDGVPAGTARPNDVLWEGNILFVQDRPLAKMVRQVARELARPFDDTEVEDAIKFCWERSADQVLDYLEQNFTLAVQPVPEETAVPNEQESETGKDTDSDVQPESDSAGLQPDSDETQEPESELDEQDQPQVDLDEDDEDEDDEQLLPPPLRPAPRPKQLTLIERYAQKSGFKRDAAQDRFFHPDGCWLQKSHGLTFPWELYSPSGELLCCYLTKEHCLQSEPLQIGAEVWEGFRRNPSAFALITTSLDGCPVEHNGQQLLDMKDEGQLVLCPATYRLALQPSDLRVGGEA